MTGIDRISCHENYNFHEGFLSLKEDPAIFEGLSCLLSRHQQIHQLTIQLDAKKFTTCAIRLQIVPVRKLTIRTRVSPRILRVPRKI